MGAIERKKQVKAEVVESANATVAKRFLEKHINKQGTRLLTDESTSYRTPAKHYNRHVVNHSKREYARGDIHVNSLESFWSHIKRSIKGTHKSVSKKHLQTYLDGFVWHYNNRNNDRLRFEALISLLA